MDLILEEYAQDGWLVLGVKGELDMATAPQLKARLLELIAAGRTRLLVDLSSVAFMGSDGLNALLVGWKQEQEQHGILRVVCPETMALKVLHLTGVDQIISVSATVAEALTAPVAQ